MKRLLPLVLCLAVGCSPSPAFQIEEATVSEIHAAFQGGTLTARALVEAYLERIEAYDDSLNAFIVLNPRALEDADRLDAEFQKTGVLRPMHGIPIVVKDNYDTEGLQTTAGSLALEGSAPPDDAYQVRVLKEAGAIVLGKTNMAEWAFSPYVTISSIDGTTRNPYDLSRVPAGSSGGTAAAVAANLGVLGLGTDTGNSIRGPSGHNALVGIRSTMGLTSRDGIVPLYLRNDIGGPMARTVEDAARVLEVIAGFDPADPITARSEGRTPESYLDALDTDALNGARIGVFRWYMRPDSTHPDILENTERAIADMQAAGAVLVDDFQIPGINLHDASIWCEVFRHDVDEYLRSRPEAPVQTLAEVLESGKYHPSIEGSLRYAVNWDQPPCPDLYEHPPNIAFREAVVQAMDTADVQAILYPTWSWPAREIGDLESPAGDNSQMLSPQSGLPAIQVPSGFTSEGLPTGITLVGRLFDEATLIGLAYSYEQKTQQRRPPPRSGAK
ncbi:MAG: amidase [Rhodothermales bacterium]|nr:amidase [Rhodothermales bacterium]